MLFGYLSLVDSINTIDEQMFHQLISDNNIDDAVIESQQYDQLLISFGKHKDLPASTVQVFDTGYNVIFILIGSVFHFQSEHISKEDLSSLLSNEYKDHGIEFINDLNGEFALCIFDFNKHENFFIKDHIGMIPLTIGKTENGIFFSTDTHGLAKTIFKDHKIEDTFIKSRFYGYAENYHYTPFKGLIRVLPAHYLRVSTEELQQTKYWFPEDRKIDSSIDFNAAVAHLDHLLRDAITCRIREHFIVGAHVSGGLDSSLVAGIAREKCAKQETFNGFSWSPDQYEFKGDQNQDERQVVIEQCKKSAITPNFTNTTVQDYLDFLVDWRTQGDFHFERVNQKNIHQKGVNLVFSGWGGDEFIGLPEDAYLIEQLKKGQVKQFFKRSKKNTLKGKLVHFYNNFLFPFRRRASFKYRSGLRLVKYLKGWDNHQEHNRSNLSSKNNYIKNLISYHHNAQRCEAWYTSGQRNGILYTFPLLDKRIIEYCFSLKMEHFARTDQNKPILRKIGEKYLANSISAHKQLLDPVLIAAEKETKHQSLKILASEIDEYENNPYLYFINFEKIKLELASIDQTDPSQTNDLTHLFSYIKSVHSYTTNVGKQ